MVVDFFPRFGDFLADFVGTGLEVLDGVTGTDDLEDGEAAIFLSEPREGLVFRRAKPLLREEEVELVGGRLAILRSALKEFEPLSYVNTWGVSLMLTELLVFLLEPSTDLDLLVWAIRF